MDAVVILIASLLETGHKVVHHGGHYGTIGGRKFPMSLIQKATHFRFLIRKERREKNGQP